MNPTIEIEVNTCFPLMYDDKSALKQDAYTLADPVSAWPGGIPEFAGYVSGAVELTGITGDTYWSLPAAKSFQKRSCNQPFSDYIKARTTELFSEYATGIVTLECASSEWTHMFDYEFHAACPYKWKNKKIWHCMGRYNEDGMLQFAFMHTPPAEDKGCTSYSLGSTDCNFMNKDIEGISMLLADAEASRNFMLDSKGKLKKALNPMLLGVISNEQPVTCIENANESVKGITIRNSNDVITVNRATIHSLFASRWNMQGGPSFDWDTTIAAYNPAIQQVATTSMLGFIYTIWGTIYRNVLYMVALKLPIPGSGTYLVKGTYDGQETWYRLTTAPGDMHLDENPNMPGDTKLQPAITAADLCVIDGVDKTPTLEALEDLGLIEVGSEEVIDANGHVVFYPIKFTNFNVENFLYWFGSDEELEDNISLATIDHNSNYSNGLKLNWQGDVFMDTSLTSSAGFMTCLMGEENGEPIYTDLALSYYSPKTIRYKYCPSETVPSTEVGGINMLLFNYAGLFPVGDPAGELQEIITEVTGIAYLCTGTKQPDYAVGGFFKKPSIPCLMGANQFCCGSVDCSEAYNDGKKIQQQCGGPFAAYQIGNPKLTCTDYRFDCDGKFLYCAELHSTKSDIAKKWEQPGLLHQGGACSSNVALQPYQIPPLDYKVGSRPLLVGGSIMGGVNYICADVKKLGMSYSILFSQGQAFNGWNSFYAKLGQDAYGMVAAKYDPTIRGDLAGGAPTLIGNKTEAMLYNDFAYTAQAPPTFRWADAIVGFYPTVVTDNSIECGGVHVFIHELDECERPSLYKVKVKRSAMKYLYDTAMLTEPQGLHIHTFTGGLIKRLGAGANPPLPVSAGFYNVTTAQIEDYFQLKGVGVMTRDIRIKTVDDRRSDRAWIPDDIGLHKYMITGMKALHKIIPYEAFEDQEFIVSARAKTFHGVCSCFSLREVSGFVQTKNLKYRSNNGRTIPVQSSCWYYLHLSLSGFKKTVQTYNYEVLKEMKVVPKGTTAKFNVPNPLLSWQVSLTTSKKNELDNNGGVLSCHRGTLSYNADGASIYTLHGNYIHPIKSYITICANRENKYLHHTEFDLWFYDDITGEDVRKYAQDETGVDIPEYDDAPTFYIPT